MHNTPADRVFRFVLFQEFRAWLVEERHINPETLAKDKQRKEFATFVEDYNTATLPHEKVRSICNVAHPHAKYLELTFARMCLI